MTVARDDLPSVDAEHPWIGLASFTESSRGYFHGRDDEITELCRRIQRKPLTVLFGKSGLGKTSILQAGVVPRLRGQGYCPVYLRVDYAESAPSASEQIKQAIVKAAEQSGRWTRAGVANESESLWAFLHHRDDVLLDADGRPLLPLLIFDQFEEIFTLAQADEQGRERAGAFRADLADLVENRPPAALEELFERDDSAYERYDLARVDYRVVISLREDYLAHLEGLKAAMPSITQNRLRLAPMTGAQALSAIIEPGRHLVNDEVAAAIVRFVAGGAEVAHAEVEPSLLSLICRELNDQRISLGRPEIGADLLAGSHTSILGEFYERSVADQPAGVRTFIEDHLLTDSGYRENVAEERVRSEFAAAGGQPDALALLVNRRLLRIEERLDLRRVELTHDVLCAIVRASRDARRERETLEASERLAADEAARARLAQRALKRARGVAAVCILLAAGAVAASVLAIVSSHRAEQAQRDAQATRLRAEQLLGYLQNDFAKELIPLGRLDLIRSLNDKVVAYFDGVPEDQRTPEWEHSRSLALLSQAETRVFQGQQLDDPTSLDVALKVLESRNVAGHRGETDLSELGRALSTRADWLVWGHADGNAALSLNQRAAGLLDAATGMTNSSADTHLIQARISQRICYLRAELGIGDRSQAEASCETARRQYAEVGALDGSDPIATAGYLYASWILMSALEAQARYDDALRVGDDALKLAGPLVAKFPAYSTARWKAAMIQAEIGNIHSTRLELAEARPHFTAALSELSGLTRADPSVANMWNDLGYVGLLNGKALLEQGLPDEAAERWSVATDVYQSAPKTSFILQNGSYSARRLADLDGELGNDTGRQSALTRWHALQGELHRSTGNDADEALKCRISEMSAREAETANNLSAAQRSASAALAAVDLVDPASFDASSCPLDLSWMLGRVLYRSGDAVRAEVALRRTMKQFAPLATPAADDLRTKAAISTWLALAQIRQGRLAEARSTLAPAIALHRALAKVSHEGALQHLEMAGALYAQALAAPTTEERRRLLNEAASVIDDLPATMHALHSFQLWHGWISSARNGNDTWPPKDAGHD